MGWRDHPPLCWPLPSVTSSLPPIPPSHRRCSQCAPLKRNKAGRTTALPYALVAGKCVACKPTGAHASSCQACNGTAPARCTKCLPTDAAKKPLYTSKHGVCTSCPAACAACDSAGRCTKCGKGKKMRKGGKCA